MKELIVALYEYNVWANERLFEAAVQLTSEQLARTFAHSFESVHRTFVHMLGAESLLFARWQGISPRSWPFEPTTLDELRTQWHQLAAVRRAHLDALENDQFGNIVNYTSLRGVRYELPRWQLMLQSANHSTHHRAEIAAMLTAMGHAPEHTEMLGFFLERANQSWTAAR